MKTSNKILIGLLIIIITIPFIATKIFKYKIAHGQFTVDAIEPSKEIPQIIQRGKLTNYKVIKIIGADTAANRYNADLFTCKIDYSAQPAYTFWKQEESDSMDIRQNGDTLIFQYKNKIEQNGRYHPNYLTLTLFIPKWVPIILDHSQLILDNQTDIQQVKNGNAGAAFYLGNQSILQLGTDVHHMKIDSANSNPGRLAFIEDTTSAPEQEIMPENIRVQAINSQVSLYNNPLFKELSLDLSEDATLSIRKGFTVEKITGQIDPKTKIESSAEAVPALASIIKNSD